MPALYIASLEPLASPEEGLISLPSAAAATMSFNRDKSKDYQKALRAFAESEVVSDFEEEDSDDLDIVASSRKQLDLSQYIDGWFTESFCSHKDADFFKC